MRIKVKFAALMSLMMSFVMSFVMTAANIGFPPYFLMAWGKAFIVGLIVAFPTAIVAGSLVSRILGPVTQPGKKLGN